MQRFESCYNSIEERIINWATNVSRKASKKSSEEKNSDEDPGKSIPHGTRSQFDDYKLRKKLTFKRIQFGAIFMCFLIIFLAWLQDYIPSYYKKFWTRGTGFWSTKITFVIFSTLL